jgi:hypothetical protein
MPLKKDAAQFWNLAMGAFAQQGDQLARAARIPNRDALAVSFDFVTTKGLFTIQQDLAALQDGSSPWSDLFAEALSLHAAVGAVVAYQFAATPVVDLR